MLFAISAPSGTGKTSISNYMLETFVDLTLSISVTTRQPRQNEIDGQHYYFKTVEEYHKLNEQNQFIETVEFNNNYYGTLKSEINRIQDLGKNVLLDIDINGVDKIKNENQDIKIVTVFILPPSIKELENRLRNRGMAEELLRQRLKIAEQEIPFAKNYDYVVINKDLHKAQGEVAEIYKKECFKSNLT